MDAELIFTLRKILFWLLNAAGDNETVREICYYILNCLANYG